MASGFKLRKARVLEALASSAAVGPEEGCAPSTPATAPPPRPDLVNDAKCVYCGRISYPLDKGACSVCARDRRRMEYDRKQIALQQEPRPRVRKETPPVEITSQAKPGELTLPDLIARWKPAPWLFVRECLGAEPDLWQDVILHAVVGLDLQGQPLPPEQPFDKIALKACKGPGKTCVEAWIAWWFLLCFEDPNILATSITGENLRDNLWKEMSIWQSKSPILAEAFEWQTTRVFLKEKPETWWMSARTWPKDADKTQQANTLAGLHARNTLLIVDESGDVPESVLVAGLAHHSTEDSIGQDLGRKQVHITLQCGNPTNVDGSLGVACTRDRDKWFVYEISGDPKDPQRAPRMRLKWCQEQIDTYGADNPWVLVNVFGKFPPTQDNKLLGPEIIKAAMSISIDPRVWRAAQRVAGFDVARSLGSDRSALARRQGPIVFPFKVWRLDDTEVLVGQVVYEISMFKPIVTFVDATGIGGPVADRLRHLGYNVIMVYFGNPARDGRRFADKRTEIWWTMANEIKGQNKVPGLALPTNPELTVDLTGPRIEFVDNKLKLESKEKMKKRGIKSPDLGDSLAMTFAEPLAEYLALPAHAREAMSTIQTDYDPYAAEE